MNGSLPHPEPLPKYILYVGFTCRMVCLDLPELPLLPLWEPEVQNSCRDTAIEGHFVFTFNLPLNVSLFYFLVLFYFLLVPSFFFLPVFLSFESLFPLWINSASFFFICIWVELVAVEF